MIYSRVSGHASMIFDDRRNDAYLRGIRKYVQPGSIVIDAGAGVGLLGLAAAAAGAGHVYLIDFRPLVHCAHEIARKANLLDRITIIQERIEDTDLPIQADLIISVFTGNLLFSEDLLPILFHARDRYLKPGGMLLPERAQLWAAPVNAPKFHQAHVGQWSRMVMGLDSSSLRPFAANEIHLLHTAELDDHRFLAEGAELCEMDFHRATRADCDARATFTVTSDGDCHGLVCWIRIRLGDDWLSSSPLDPRIHWSPACLPLDPPLPLKAGERINVRVQRPEHGEWTWWVEASAGSRIHSTFLARSEGPKEFGQAGRPKAG